MNLEQIPSPLVRTDKALEGQVTYELLGLTERDLHHLPPQFWLHTVLGIHPSQHSDHWEGAL